MEPGPWKSSVRNWRGCHGVQWKCRDDRIYQVWKFIAKLTFCDSGNLHDQQNMGSLDIFVATYSQSGTLHLVQLIGTEVFNYRNTPKYRYSTLKKGRVFRWTLRANITCQDSQLAAWMVSLNLLETSTPFPCKNM